MKIIRTKKEINMKVNDRNRRIAALLLAVLTVSVTLMSCGGGSGVKGGDGDRTAAQAEAAETTQAEETGSTAPPYDYPDVDYEGASFRVYNPGEMWQMYVDLDHPEQTGEPLDDEVFKRNRRVEEMLNITVDEIEEADVHKIISTASASILAGSDDYDVVYVGANLGQSMATNGYFNDITKLDGLRLDEPWYDRQLLDSLSVAGKTFFGASDFHLMIYDASWPLFFNEDMLTNLNMEFPYDMVRKGIWTIDRFAEYQKAAVALNGDEGWAWNMNGNCVYGMSTHGDNAHNYFFYSTMARFIELDKDRLPVFKADSELFYDRVTRIAALFDTKAGLTFKGHTSDFSAELGGYFYVFANGRALFLTIGLKGANQLRDYDLAFGIVPFPKYDEAQEEYCTTTSTNVLLFTIPVTCAALERTAVVLDVLSYESYVNVKPVFYETTVQQKGLRNENSIEMLDYLFANRGMDLGVQLGWATSLTNSIRTLLYNGEDGAASIVEAQRNAVEAKAAAYIEALEKQV